MTRLAAVRTEEVPEDQAARQPAASQTVITQQAATKMLMMALSALSQRLVIAFSNLFTLLTVASCFYVWAFAMPNITVLQIVGLSIYSLFILLVNMFGRQK